MKDLSAVLVGIGGGLTLIGVITNNLRAIGLGALFTNFALIAEVTFRTEGKGERV